MANKPRGKPFPKGHKINLGREKSPETIEKWRGKMLGRFSEEKHPQWKGDEITYSAVHKWMSKKSGQPRYCEHCKRTDQKKYEWANISKEYKRIVTDWLRLCTKCHRKYDKIS